jgi:hypothetical protein
MLIEASHCCCRHERKGEDPQTPDVRTKCSKRCFDGLLRSWRRRLHRYDPPDMEAPPGHAGAVKPLEQVDDEPCTPVAKRRASGVLNDADRQVTAEDEDEEDVRIWLCCFV